MTRSDLTDLTLWLALIMTSTVLVHAQSSSQVIMHDTSGKRVGTATIKAAASSGVEVRLDLTGLPPGEHAFHFHETPKCDPPSFESAGAHLNPAAKQHGLQNPLGPHSGDMNNVTVGKDGRLKTTVTNTRVTLGSEPASLSRLGAALVIHADPDDMKSDPAGNAGDRIVCGVIEAR
jgi:Cu-Zn family superoxide dismutase